MKLCILALDQAETSGYALWLTDPGQPLGLLASHGTAKSARERTAVLEAAEGLAKANSALLWVIFEDHTKIPARMARSTATLVGMGDARGRWHEQLDLRGHAKSQRMAVTPQVWRGAVLGAFYASAKTDVAKAAALRHAGALTHRECTSHDAAEAVCLGQYAARNLPTILQTRTGSLERKGKVAPRARGAA